jgi:sigma-B regulation protein RsbU (phosphoserine phosphatase)
MDDSLNSAPCGFLSFRDDGSIIEVNNTLCDWLGYATGTLEGRNIETVLTIASRIFYNTHLFPLVRMHLKADEIFLSLKCKDGRDIPVLSNTVRKSCNGEYENHSIFIAVHQRKKFEEEILLAKKSAEDALHHNEGLINLNKKLEARTQELDTQYSRLLAITQNLLQFSKIISHDLQEPIHKITLFTNMIEAEGNVTDGNKRALRKIQMATQKLKVLTSGLQEFIKVDAEKSYRQVDLQNVLEQARQKAVEGRAFDDFSLASDGLPSVEGSEAQLVLLFYHLIDNSIVFRKPSERLEIVVSGTIIEENVYRSTPDKYKYVKHVQITFQDNGIGFENKYNQYVFDLVKKLNPETKGLGIGLSLSKKIVDNHSGTISVESHVGKGTRFTIVLPLKAK